MKELPAFVFDEPNEQTSSHHHLLKTSSNKLRDIDLSVSTVLPNYYWAVLLDDPSRPEAARDDIFIAGRQVFSEEKLIRIGRLSVEELLTHYSPLSRELGAQLYAKRSLVV